MEEVNAKLQELLIRDGLVVNVVQEKNVEPEVSVNVVQEKNVEPEVSVNGVPRVNASYPENHFDTRNLIQFTGNVYDFDPRYLEISHDLKIFKNFFKHGMLFTVNHIYKGYTGIWFTAIQNEETILILPSEFVSSYFELVENKCSYDYWRL